jgi:hypothetical protein
MSYCTRCGAPLAADVTLPQEMFFFSESSGGAARQRASMAWSATTNCLTPAT